MALRNIEQDPVYQALLDELLDEVAPLVEAAEGPMRRREGFIFLSAPGSVTPTHVDPEHNILLQVRGTKEFNVGVFSDRTVEARHLERVYRGGHCNVDQQPDELVTHALAPGDGLYVRPDAPHFVLNGPTPSVSLSITWRTPVIRRAERVHRANGRLRQLHLRPKPPGHSPARDGAKAAVARVDTAFTKLARR